MQNLRTNITTVRLIDPTNTYAGNIVKDLNFVQQRMNLNMAPLQVDQLTVDAILMYDAVNVYANALKGLYMTSKIIAEPLQCMNSPFVSWSHGFKLINFMRVVSTILIIMFDDVSKKNGSSLLDRNKWSVRSLTI